MIDYVIYDRKSGNECWFVLCKISLIYHISVYVLMAWYVMVRANKIYKINYCIFGIYVCTTPEWTKNVEINAMTHTKQCER